MAEPGISVGDVGDAGKQDQDIYKRQVANGSLIVNLKQIVICRDFSLVYSLACHDVTDYVLNQEGVKHVHLSEKDTKMIYTRLLYHTDSFKDISNFCTSCKMCSDDSCSVETSAMPSINGYLRPFDLRHIQYVTRFMQDKIIKKYELHRSEVDLLIPEEKLDSSYRPQLSYKPYEDDKLMREHRIAWDENEVAECVALSLSSRINDYRDILQEYQEKLAYDFVGTFCCREPSTSGLRVFKSQTEAEEHRVRWNRVNIAIGEQMVLLRAGVKAIISPSKPRNYTVNNKDIWQFLDIHNEREGEQTCNRNLYLTKCVPRIWSKVAVAELLTPSSNTKVIYCNFLPLFGERQLYKMQNDAESLISEAFQGQESMAIYTYMNMHEYHQDLTGHILLENNLAGGLTIALATQGVYHKLNQSSLNGLHCELSADFLLKIFHQIPKISPKCTLPVEMAAMILGATAKCPPPQYLQAGLCHLSRFAHILNKIRNLQIIWKCQAILKMSMIPADFKEIDISLLTQKDYCVLIEKITWQEVSIYVLTDLTSQHIEQYCLVYQYRNLVNFCRALILHGHPGGTVITRNMTPKDYARCKRTDFTTYCESYNINHIILPHCYRGLNHEAMLLEFIKFAFGLGRICVDELIFVFVELYNNSYNPYTSLIPTVYVGTATR